MLLVYRIYGWSDVAVEVRHVGFEILEMLPVTMTQPQTHKIGMMIVPVFQLLLLLLVHWAFPVVDMDTLLVTVVLMFDLLLVMVALGVVVSLV